MRLSDEELKEVMNKNNVDRLYSWSMVNTFMTSPYEYYLKYVLHKEGDLQNCVYGTMGGLSHDILERLYNQEIEYSDMDNIYDDSWLTAVTIADLKFDRNDEAHNQKLSENYYANLKHFFSNHTMIPYKVMTERFITTKINDYILQGYIDCIFKDDNDCINIIDFKTSSMYKGKTLEEHSGQLTVYALGVMQSGVPLTKIRIAFNFLKYCTIQYEQKNGTLKTRDVERRKIGESLQSNVKTWLKAAKYSEEEIDDYLMQMIDTNGISCLPEDIQAKYKITDCYVYIPLTDELIKHWTDLITCEIKDILLREKDYQDTHSEAVFYDTQESVKAQSYYFATLCEYSANLHKPYKEYLESRENGVIDLFGNVGADVKEEVQSSVVDTSLDWLNDI